jgi:hypothetical protein
MMNKKLFWIFGILQHILLGTILFLIFHCFNTIHVGRIIGLDTQLFICISFPLFSLLVRYISLVKSGEE